MEVRKISKIGNINILKIMLKGKIYIYK